MARNPISDSTALLLGLAAFAGVGVALYATMKKPAVTAAAAPTIVAPIPGLPSLVLAPSGPVTMTAMRRRA